SRPLTLAVLGARWRDASTIFAGFTLVALYTPIASAVGWQLTSRGRGHDFLVLSTVASAATVAAFVAGLPFGPAGVAFAYSIACLAVILPITYHIVGREGPVRTSDLWLRFFIHLPVWIVVCAATWLTRTLVVTQAPWTELLICVPAGLLVGGAFIAVYPPSRKAALSLIEALRERIHFRT
ncbi:MAG TPA: hypothetical protein VLU94_01470, partial [Candidatus Nitrosotalea sp.]|nr:hypothetical protein [Candidatus Nitrosotalea sp.]